MCRDADMVEVVIMWQFLHNGIQPSEITFFKYDRFCWQILTTQQVCKVKSFLIDTHCNWNIVKPVLIIAFTWNVVKKLIFQSKNAVLLWTPSLIFLCTSLLILNSLKHAVKWNVNNYNYPFTIIFHLFSFLLTIL